MNIALIGPLTKDCTMIHGASHEHIGSIPYYIGKALYALEVPCTLFISHEEKDNAWVARHLRGIEYTSFYSPTTLQVTLQYNQENINEREQQVTYTPFPISYEMLAPQIEAYDTIIMGPLFYDDLDIHIFKQLAHKRIILGNFGMFTYVVDGKMTKKHPERVWDILPYVEYLFLDNDEILFLAQKKTVEASVTFLQQRVKNIIVTHGSSGSTLYTENSITTIPAFPPNQLVDPTGAGDTYLGAFIAAQMRYDSIQDIGKFAAMAATSKIEYVGGLTTKRSVIESKLRSY